MEKKKLEITSITNYEELVYLIRRFKKGPNFARAFKFENNSLKLQFFDSIGVDLNRFVSFIFIMIRQKTFIFLRVSLDIFGSAR